MPAKVTLHGTAPFERKKEITKEGKKRKADRKKEGKEGRGKQQIEMKCRMIERRPDLYTFKRTCFSVKVCVCERERERVNAYESVRERERARY